MSYSVAQPLSKRRDFSIKTWQLFVLVLLANIVLTWLFNEQVLTRDAYHSLLSERMESTRIDQYFELLREISFWGYLAQPLVLWLQITFVALLIQMPLVLTFVDIPIRYLFRLVTWASLLMVATVLVRFLWLSSLESSEISRNVLNLMPFSINHFLDATRYPLTAYSILGKVNVFELMWCYVIYKGLVATEQIKKEYAALLILSIWTVLLLFQWGLALYFQGADA